MSNEMKIRMQREKDRQKVFTENDYKNAVASQRSKNISTMNKQNALLYSAPILLAVGLIVASLLT